MEGFFYSELKCSKVNQSLLYWSALYYSEVKGSTEEENVVSLFNCSECMYNKVQWD